MIKMQGKSSEGRRTQDAKRGVEERAQVRTAGKKNEVV